MRFSPPSSNKKALAEIGTLKKHIINYSKTRSTYEEYRKVGYSKKFLEAHREEITLHKAAKAAFDEVGVKKASEGEGTEHRICRGPDRQKAGLRRVPLGKK